MVWCHEAKYFFVHIPKTGGTSVHKVLHSEESGGYGVKNKKAVHHCTASEYIQRFGQDVWDEYVTFAVCRNPYDRFLSSFYASPIPNLGFKNKQSIDEFIQSVKEIVKHQQYDKGLYHEHVRPQTDFIFLPNCTQVQVQLVFRIENVLTGLAPFLKQHFGIDEHFPHENKSTTQNKVKLTESQKQKISTLYAKDFERLGYRT